ncbi:hypothetical protein F7D01_05465 [Erythrobacter sp. 3-20A1M]|uniref:hypothetical protein n=1 Tax=Erythrobacter sp. 3-20A1M TaxID=2653850 RepID=UPI001BFCBB54|nr:hypothetical protein [Erythrobacter sp. 3-20A1M]QWC56615.1 hypothetical protein F7D01_05465 [Erythrobacter sp. 3-20A1M]
MRSKYRELNERFRYGLTSRDAYDAIMVSYGGSGTTFILQYLSQYLAVNSWDSHNDGIKHANRPDHPIFEPLQIGKCVYVYSDPIQAVLSLFRREFQSHMSLKLTDEGYSSVREYNRRTKGQGESFTLEEMLDAGEDRFGIIRHWRNWNDIPVRFPTLFVRFEHLYENLPAFFDFLELTEEQRAAFPPQRKRLSSVSQVDDATRDALRAIYGEVYDEMERLPPVYRRG